MQIFGVRITTVKDLIKELGVTGFGFIFGTSLVR